MSDLILFRRDDSSLSVSALELAAEMEEKALAAASMIGRVRNAEDNERAVAAQIELKTYLNAVEESFHFVKKPGLEFCRQCDALRHHWREKAAAEMMRISRLAGDFQEQEKAKARAAEAARLKDLEEIERKRMLELAKAETVNQADEIQRKYNEITAALPVVEAVKAQGQRVTEDWDIVVTDPLLLANAHRACVDITPRMGMIKTLLKNGVNVAGIIATPIVKAGIRVPKNKAIEV